MSNDGFFVEFLEDVGTVSPFAASAEVIVLVCLGVSTSRIFFADIKLRGGGRCPSFAMSFRFTLLCGTDIQILLNPSWSGLLLTFALASVVEPVMDVEKAVVVSIFGTDTFGFLNL